MAKRKPKPARPEQKAPADAKRVERPAQRSGTVTLWGEILEEDTAHLKMAIKNHGDALDVGLNGTHWIAKRQLFGPPRNIDGFDYVRVSFQYASLLAQSSQQCD